MSEADIIILLKKRDQSAVQELLTHYTPLFKYIISPILKQNEDQDECISDIAMRVWERINSYDPEKGSFTSWLTAVARNTALNHARLQKAHPSFALSDDIADVSPSPEEAILNDELRISLSRAIDELSLSDRELFFRKYYYMQSTSQISAEIGITERAVEGRLYRIKKRLKKRLGGESYV